MSEEKPRVEETPVVPPEGAVDEQRLQSVSGGLNPCPEPPIEMPDRRVLPGDPRIRPDPITRPGCLIPKP